MRLSMAWYRVQSLSGTSHPKFTESPSPWYQVNLAPRSSFTSLVFVQVVLTSFKSCFQRSLNFLSHEMVETLGMRFLPSKGTVTMGTQKERGMEKEDFHVGEKWGKGKKSQHCMVLRLFVNLPFLANFNSHNQVSSES